MKRHNKMLRQVAVASATASLLITMAGPAFAQTAENETASSGRAKIHRVATERPMGKFKGANKGVKRGGNQPNWNAASTAGQKFDRTCLKAERAKEQGEVKDAAKTMETALKDARTARDAAYAQAKAMTDKVAAKAARKAADKEYRSARTDAQKAFAAAKKSIHAALVASDAATCPALK